MNRCPKCGGKPVVVFDFDVWFFTCMCGWESKRYDRRTSPNKKIEEAIEKAIEKLEEKKK